MEYERFEQHDVLRLDPGEEVMATLLDFVRRENIEGAYFLAFGGFSSVHLRYFDVESKQFRPHDVDQQVEVVSLLGNVARGDVGPIVHVHVAVSDAQARTYSGHLAEGVVRPTLEVFLTRLEGRIRRVTDPSTGLELLALPGRPNTTRRRGVAQ